MNRSEIEQLQDEIIGEAVLSILRDNGPINNKAVIARLQAMEAREVDSHKREAIARVIEEVSDKLATPRRAAAHEVSEPDRSNVYSLFGEESQSRISKKH
ncbi:MAG TPA: hypothetical protein VJS14_15150 [Enterobacteriaceae bacterium]|nr:hypothetical protein [Enterobacteriaceae bacterium]